MSLTQSFHLEAVEHVYRVAEEEGYSVLLSAVTASRSLDTAVEPLISGSCEGILVVGMHTVPRSLEEANADLPVVVLGHAPWTGQYDVVRTAGDIGMEAAVDRLVSLGHTHIVHVDGSDKSGAEERRVGYRTAMERHGLGDLVRVEEGGADEEEGLRAGTALFSGDREVTAVTCYNDSCAVGVVDAALRAGLSIPGDVSVIGYDNSPVARTKYIDLTTVAQDTPKLAELAVRRLLAVIDDPGRPREEIVLPPHLVERTSIGPAPTH
jgi:Transcriptional regulators